MQLHETRNGKSVESAEPSSRQPVKKVPDETDVPATPKETGGNDTLYSRFWFWKNNAVDELALKAIKECNIDKAIAIWEEVILGKQKKKLSPVVLIDNLISHTAGWPEEMSTSQSLLIQDNEYIISREKQTGSTIPCVYADLNYEDNWTIEVDTKWFEGVDKYSYGIVFGKGQNSYYSFVITANGHFSLVEQFDGGYNELIPWKKAFAINKCNGNHLLLKKIEDQITLYINNNQVASMQSEPFFGQNFGFKVWGNQKVSFRNFKFCKLTEDNASITVNEDNYSCIKNLSMLYLSMATNSGTFQIEHFKKGIELARYFFVSEHNEGYAKLVEGANYFFYPEKTLNFYINEVVDSIKEYLDKPGGITTNELINSFASFPVETQRMLSDRFFSKQLQNIEKQLDIAKEIKKNSTANAADAGKTLVRNTREDISYLKQFLGESDPEYVAIADKLAHEIMQCGIDYYSHLFDMDYKVANKSMASYLPEHEYALSIAVSERVRERLKEILYLYRKKIRESKGKPVSGRSSAKK
jgi:hypothetical protein